MPNSAPSSTDTARARSEGSGGPDMIRLGAGIDCQKGRYAQGIKALEDLLNRNLIPYPPAQY